MKKPIYHWSFSISNFPFFIAIWDLKHKGLPTMENEKWKMTNDK